MDKIIDNLKFSNPSYVTLVNLQVYFKHWDSNEGHRENYEVGVNLLQVALKIL